MTCQRAFLVVFLLFKMVQMKIVSLGYKGRGNGFLRHCATLEFLSLSADVKSPSFTVRLVLCGSPNISTQLLQP